LAFHGVSSRRRPELPADAQPRVDAAMLEAILAWLARRFRFLNSEELLAGERGVLLTFDDGLASVAAQALPPLQAYGAPAALFVTTQHVETPSRWLPAYRAAALRGFGALERVPPALGHELYDGLSREQLARCARHPLLTIGSHTVTHPDLTRLSRE